MPAGDLLTTAIHGNEADQHALAAWSELLGSVVIQARRLVLEDESRPPRRVWKVLVSAFLQEFKFFLEHRQEVAIIVYHGRPPSLVVEVHA